MSWSPEVKPKAADIFSGEQHSKHWCVLDHGIEILPLASGAHVHSWCVWFFFMLFNVFCRSTSMAFIHSIIFYILCTVAKSPLAALSPRNHVIWCKNIKNLHGSNYPFIRAPSFSSSVDAPKRRSTTKPRPALLLKNHHTLARSLLMALNRGHYITNPNNGICIVWFPQNG